MGIFEEFDDMGVQMSARINASFDALTRDIDIIADRIADDRYPLAEPNTSLGYTSLEYLRNEPPKGETS